MRIQHTNRYIKIFRRFRCVWGHLIHIYQLFVWLNSESVPWLCLLKLCSPETTSRRRVHHTSLLLLMLTDDCDQKPTQLSLSLSTHCDGDTINTWIKITMMHFKRNEVHFWGRAGRMSQVKRKRCGRWENRNDLSESQRQNLKPWSHYSVGHFKVVSVRF